MLGRTASLFWHCWSHVQQCRPTQYAEQCRYRAT